MDKDQKYTYIVPILFLIFLLFPGVLLARDVSITPAILNFKAGPRDILEETITVKNLTGHRLDVYASVNNVDPEEGKKEFESIVGEESAGSLANWIRVSRQVIELEDNEEREIPIEIRVNLRANPGTYHAIISFSSGSNRLEAERGARIRGEQLTINVEVLEDIRERLQLGTFTSDKVFFSGPEVALSFNLENIGNRALTPTGEVHIYDRRGRELASIPANELNTEITPNNNTQLGAVWNATGNFGRYKAFLDVEYGSNQQGTVNDTVYFWVIPWQRILILFLLLASIVGGGTYIWYGRVEKDRGAFAYIQAPLQNNSQGEYPEGDHVLDMRDNL